MIGIAFHVSFSFSFFSCIVKVVARGDRNSV